MTSRHFPIEMCSSSKPHHLHCNLLLTIIGSNSLWIGAGGIHSLRKTVDTLLTGRAEENYSANRSLFQEGEDAISGDKSTVCHYVCTGRLVKREWESRARRRVFLIGQPTKTTGVRHWWQCRGEFILYACNDRARPGCRTKWNECRLLTPREPTTRPPTHSRQGEARQRE